MILDFLRRTRPKIVLSMSIVFGAASLLVDFRIAGAAETAPAKLTKLPKLLSAEELQDGWISLFDGQTLFGWHAGSKADWRVLDGAIVVSKGEKGLLCTSVRFDNYELKLDFRSAEGTNSGVFLRTPLVPTDPAADCYELNIAPPDNPFPTGGLVKRIKATPTPDTREWQSFHVTVDRNQVKVLLDGQLVCDYTDPAPADRLLPPGFIGLQLNEGRAEFRNIRVKPLGTASIFNGQDLSGWKTYPQMASKFTVRSGRELHVENGKGQLETEKAYRDFVLQLECHSHAKNLNSGVFFRCIPGQEMNGYECQIHNGYKDGDRTKPVDCGTGGIFRRQDARIVAADDQQWFPLTLIADGPRFAAWVNGLQVSDWTDARKADENPRRGLRRDAGTIMLQGHDPTTNLSFRNLRIAEMGR